MVGGDQKMVSWMMKDGCGWIKIMVFMKATLVSNTQKIITVGNYGITRMGWSRG